MDALLLKFRCTEFCSQLMIISQRRKGKTFSVAMFAAAVMIAIDAYNEPFVQSIFSTGRRASQKLLYLGVSCLSSPRLTQTHSVSNAHSHPGRRRVH